MSIVKALKLTNLRPSWAIRDDFCKFIKDGEVGLEDLTHLLFFYAEMSVLYLQRCGTNLLKDTDISGSMEIMNSILAEHAIALGFKYYHLETGRAITDYGIRALLDNRTVEEVHQAIHLGLSEVLKSHAPEEDTEE